MISNLTGRPHVWHVVWCEDKRVGVVRAAGPIAKIKMIGRWIIEVHAALGKAQAEDLSVKIDVALRIARDGSDMMNPAEFHNRTKG